VRAEVSDDDTGVRGLHVDGTVRHEVTDVVDVIEVPDLFVDGAVRHEVSDVVDAMWRTICSLVAHGCI